MNENTNTITWELKESTLTIKGNGAMQDYSPLNAPWYPQRMSIIAIIIEDGIESIGNNAFSMCSDLTSITISNSVTNIGKNAFECCDKLTSINIPNSVISIKTSAFFACGLTSVVIPNSVISIKRDTFACCKSLISITISDSITSIEDAFWGCENLKHIYLQCTTPISINKYFTEKSFSTLANSCILHVPVGSKDKYEQTERWKEFNNIQEDIITNY